LQDLDQERDDDKRRFLTVVEHLGIGLRRAYSLARISRIFDGSGISEDRLHSVGWSKLAIIGRFLTEGNAEALLQAAEQNTAHNLQVLLRGEVPVAKARVLVLYLDQSDYSYLRKVLLSNGALPTAKGLRNVEVALMKFVRSHGA
jgi:hypothetical protein